MDPDMPPYTFTVVHLYVNAHSHVLESTRVLMKRQVESLLRSTVEVIFSSDLFQGLAGVAGLGAALELAPC